MREMDWGAYLKETWMTFLVVLAAVYAVYRAGTAGEWFWLIISLALIAACFGILVLEREKLTSD